MNGTENFAMTGSSNARTEQLAWLSEVASAVSKGTLNQDHNATSNLGTSPLLVPNTGPVFTPPTVLARHPDVSVRMFAPPFHVERARHVQSASASGTGTTLYYSQAPRSTPYSNFFQATYSSPMSFSSAASPSVTTSAVNPVEPARSYLQMENYQPLIGIQTIGSSHLQIPCSPGYLQQHPPLPSSPTNLAATRLLHQGAQSILIRSPDGTILQERDTAQVGIQLSPVVTQILDDGTQRNPFPDSVLCNNQVVETTLSSIHPSDFTIVKEPCQPRTSPSGYRMPTGKEGSLKHRILRPPSISIVDPPPSVLSDAPLSAPPIRTHREPSPKQARSIPSSGYRSFSSSASSLTENRIAASPFHNHRSSLSSGSPSPAPPTSPTAAQLKYPQSFMKGAIIQLADNKLKHVENMTTEDFIECGALSNTLRIDSSTVTSIEKTPATGAAKLGFHVGQNNIQITVEAPLEHPFFVYKQGWSSCSPERSAQRYGLSCHKLKVGDTCVSITDKPRTVVNGGAKSCVPPENSSTEKNSLAKTVEADETKEVSQALCFNQSVPEKRTNAPEKSTKSDPPFLLRKRKRRWSAPDNIPPNDDDTSA